MTAPNDAEPARPVRLDVVLTAEDVAPDRLGTATVLVVDVLRASTTMLTALANGAAAIVPVATPDDARHRASEIPGALLAGERRGEPIPGFDVGNSPVAVTPERVRGRTIVFTTSNGTRALLATRGAAAVGIAALVNLSAAVEWAERERRDVTVVCSGSRGAVSLEDHVCAGLLVDRLAARVSAAELTASGASAVELGRAYGKDVARLATDAPWARRLAAGGYGADVAACLALDTLAVMAVYRPDVDKVVSRPR